MSEIRSFVLLTSYVSLLVRVRVHVCVLIGAKFVSALAAAEVFDWLSFPVALVLDGADRETMLK